jgi:hypothetical protein
VVDSSHARVPSRFRTQHSAPIASRIIHEDAPSHAEEVSLAERYALKGESNDNFRLMHHYAISTCYSITDLTSVSRSLPLRDIVPALGFEHDFLLSGLLAVSSLHLAILNPSAIHTASAIKHHTEALAQVVPHLANISSDNVTALFSFSCLIALYSFGFHQTQAPSADPLGDIFEVFTLIRGIRIIVRDEVQWLQQTPFAESMLPNPLDPNASLAPKIEAAISTLSQYNSKQITDLASRDVYAAAIDLLRQTFLLAAEKPSAKMTALPFPILVPDEFMEKLRGRDPMALVILANYAVALYWLRGYIWLRGWGKEVVDAVKHTVGTEMRFYLEWATEEVERRDVEV